MEEGRVESMPSTEIKAFLEEFPWVKGVVKGPITYVCVSRLEPALLNYSPEYPNNGFIRSIGEYIYLLNREAKIITVELKKNRKKYFIFGPIVSKIKKISSVVRWGTTVQSVLDKMGEEVDSVHFILSYYEYIQTVIIYKLPKGISMLKWIQDEIESEKIKFQNVR